MKTTNLDKWLYLVRRIEEHREEKAVRELQKLYRSLIKDLRKVMGNAFADYADPETGRLTYADLHRRGLDARLLEEVAAHVSSVSSEESRIIRETVEQTYANCYSGMVQAVGKAVDNEELKEAFSAVEAVKPEVLRAAVNNPVHGLTLSDQLEKNRADIVWGIKQAVGVGLSEGDNYTTMAKRIQKELIGPDGSGGSYYKAVRIARTEAHRVREEGNLDAAQNLTEKLEPAGMTMVKTWHTMKDERVRPNRARKTKGGWKYSKGGKYDHQKMEGVQVPINEEFTLPSGAKTQAPGKSGVAGEDINCRCFLSYDVIQKPDTIEVPDTSNCRYPTNEDFSRLSKQCRKQVPKDVRLQTEKHKKPDGSPGGYIATHNYSNINSHLRGDGFVFNSLDADDYKTIDAMHKAISACTLDGDYIFTRYVNADYLSTVFGVMDDSGRKLGNTDIDFIHWGGPRHKRTMERAVKEVSGYIGKTVPEKAFISTSMLRDKNIMRDKAVRFNIRAVKGTHCYVTKNRKESEAIFDAGSRLYILDVHSSIDGKLDIDAVLLEGM